MDTDGVSAALERDGFVVLPELIPDRDLESAREALTTLYPSQDEFHADPSAREYARLRSEFGGIVAFPFAAVELSLLSVHPKLIELAELLLGTGRVRVYSIEAWAKYAGAANYEQHHHRDYLNHTLLVPSWDRRFRQIEMFLYLSDVTPESGAPAFVPRATTEAIAALPNWLPPDPGAEPDPVHPSWISPSAHRDLYDHEVLATGKAGTVVAYTTATFHRGTEITAPRSARFTLQVGWRPADSDWAARKSWIDDANSPAWHTFVEKASPHQLALFGFPQPGHAFWSAETIAAMRHRYPALDITPWAGGKPEELH